MQAILDAGICTKTIVMETNVKYPPHIWFAMAPGYEDSRTDIATDDFLGITAYQLLYYVIKFNCLASHK